MEGKMSRREDLLERLAEEKVKVTDLERRLDFEREEAFIERVRASRISFARTILFLVSAAILGIWLSVPDEVVIGLLCFSMSALLFGALSYIGRKISSIFH